MKDARQIRLAANDGMAENTLQEPTRIHPTCHQLSPNGDELEVNVPANSLNIIRITSR